MTTPARRRSLLDWYLPSVRIRRRDLWLRYVLVFVLLGPIGVLVLGIAAGFLGTQPQPNRYGPPPRVRAGEQGD